jgi:hypothetical protein
LGCTQQQGCLIAHSSCGIEVAHVSRRRPHWSTRLHRTETVTSRLTAVAQALNNPAIYSIHMASGYRSPHAPLRPVSHHTQINNMSQLHVCLSRAGQTCEHPQILHATCRLCQVYARLVPQRRCGTQHTSCPNQHPQRKPPPEGSSIGSRSPAIRPECRSALHPQQRQHRALPGM